MPDLQVTRKNFTFQYRGQTNLGLNSANASWLGNVLRLYRESTGSALAIQSYAGLFGGQTPGGAVTQLVPGYSYRIIVGLYDGSWSIPDAVLVDSIPFSSSAPDPGLAGLNGVLLATSYGATLDGVTDDTDAMLRAIDAAHSQNKLLLVPQGTARIRGVRKKGETTTIGLQLPTGLAMYGLLDKASTVFKALPPPSGGTFTGRAAAPPDTNLEFSHLLYGVGASNIALARFAVDGNLAAMPFSANPYLNYMGVVSERAEMGGVCFQGGAGNKVSQLVATKLGGFGFRWDSSLAGVGQAIAADNCVNGGLGFTMFSNSQVGCDNTLVEDSRFTDNHSDQIRFHTNNVTVRGGFAGRGKRNPGTYAPATQNFAAAYCECATNCVVDDVELVDSSSFAFDFWIGAPGNYYFGGTYNNPLAIDSAATPGNQVINCKLVGNANGGGRIYQKNTLVQRNYIYNNGFRTLDNFSDNTIVNPYGVHIVSGATGVKVLDNIFRCDNGKQLAAISPENGAGNFASCTFAGNHVTGQALFNIAQVDASNQLYDNYPTAQNGYTRTTTPRSSVPNSAYVQLGVGGTGNKAIQWNWSLGYNGEYNIPAGQASGTLFYVATISTPASGTGQMRIVNNSADNQFFTIPEVAHYIFGSPTKQVTIPPGHVAYFQVDIYPPAEGNYVNWFYQDQTAGGTPTQPAANTITAGTVMLAASDGRIIFTNTTADGTNWGPLLSPNQDGVYGTGTGDIYNIPAGLRYRVYGYTSFYFGAIEFAHNGAAVTNGLTEGVATTDFTPVMIYEMLAPLASVTKLTVRIPAGAPVGKSICITRVEFF